MYFRDNCSRCSGSWIDEFALIWLWDADPPLLPAVRITGSRPPDSAADSRASKSEAMRVELENRLSWIGWSFRRAKIESNEVSEYERGTT